VGFGQHQTFYLRTYWLRKAIQQIDNKSNRVLFDKNVSELIGLGSNMVNSLKHWIVAADICKTSKRDSDNKIVHVKTPFGEIFNTYDPYIEINDTASIIHYHLIDKKEPCTTWYWFFNEYEKKSFEKDEILHDIVGWINNEYETKPSLDTLDRDIDCLIKQYYSKGKSTDPEEVIISPLAILNLIDERDGKFYKRNPSYEEIGLTALMYVLLKYNQYEISINQIEKSKFLWGKVFNLQRNEIVKAIEQLASSSIYPLEFDRTNRLDLVRVKQVNPIEFLKEEYIRKERVLK
jgi:hypothetical protein